RRLDHRGDRSRPGGRRGRRDGDQQPAAGVASGGDRFRQAVARPRRRTGGAAGAAKGEGARRRGRTREARGGGAKSGGGARRGREEGGGGPRGRGQEGGGRTGSGGEESGGGKGGAEELVRPVRPGDEPDSGERLPRRQEDLSRR